MLPWQRVQQRKQIIQFLSIFYWYLQNHQEVIEYGKSQGSSRSFSSAQRKRYGNFSKHSVMTKFFMSFLFFLGGGLKIYFKLPIRTLEWTHPPLPHQNWNMLMKNLERILDFRSDHLNLPSSTSLPQGVICQALWDKLGILTNFCPKRQCFASQIVFNPKHPLY